MGSVFIHDQYKHYHTPCQFSGTLAGDFSPDKFSLKMFKVIFFDGTSILFPAKNVRDAVTHAQKQSWDYKVLVPA